MKQSIPSLSHPEEDSAAGSHVLREKLADFISADRFPCVAAKAANAQDNIELAAARDITAPTDDVAIYQALGRFGKELAADDLHAGYRTFAVVFEGPRDLDEDEFEAALWNRLQNLHNFDAVRGKPWDGTVDNDPKSPHFSMSIAGFAFFVVGLHPAASRPARRFAHPTMVFNLHAQFERLREAGRFERLQEIIRERDADLAGGINPTLADYAEDSEARQYSGRPVEEDWECPLEIQEKPDLP